MKLTKGLLNAYKIQGFSDEVMQHILENQEIVNIVKLWTQSELTSPWNGNKLTQEQLNLRRSSACHLISLIRDKTRVDIGESS